MIGLRKRLPAGWDSAAPQKWEYTDHETFGKAVAYHSYQLGIDDLRHSKKTQVAYQQAVAKLYTPVQG